MVWCKKTMHRKNTKSTRKTNPRRVPSSADHGHARVTSWPTNRERVTISDQHSNIDTEAKVEATLQAANNVSSFTTYTARDATSSSCAKGTTSSRPKKCEHIKGSESSSSISSVGDEGKVRDDDAASSTSVIFDTPFPTSSTGAAASARHSVDDGDSKPSAAKSKLWKVSDEDDNYESNPRDDLEQGLGVTAPAKIQNSAPGSNPVVASIASPENNQVLPGAVNIEGPGGPRHDNDFSVNTVHSEEESTAVSGPPLLEAVLVQNDNQSLILRRLQAVENRLQIVEPAVHDQEVIDTNTGQTQDTSIDNEGIMQPNNSNKCNLIESRRNRCYVVAFGLALFAIAVISGAVLGQSTTQASNSPEELKRLIVSVSLDGGASLEEASSPQSRALLWLEGNTFLANFPDWQKVQRYVLATLYYSTNGTGWDNWSGWLSDNNQCEWHDSCSSCDPCENDGQSISCLCLYLNGLKGTIPQELALLSNPLDGLHLWDNQITGTIPTEFGLLTSMTYLSLRDNALGGTIPRMFDAMTNLDDLYLFGNDFTGEFECPSFIDYCGISCWDPPQNKSSPCRIL